MAAGSEDLLPTLAAFYDPHLVKAIVSDEAMKTKGAASVGQLAAEVAKVAGDAAKPTEAAVKELKDSILDLLAIIEMPALLSELHKCQTIQAMTECQFHIPEMPAAPAEGEAQAQQQPTSFRQVTGVTKQQLENLYKYAHMIYGQGNYSDCADLLVVYNQQLRILEKDPEAEVTVEKQLNVKWGLLACYILDGKWEQAAFAALILDAVLDERLSGSAKGKQELLKQRTCLVHWLLFITFKVPADKAEILEKGQASRVIELLISEKYLTLMSFYAPHLFRYAACAFLFYKPDKNFKDDLVHILGHEYRKKNEEGTPTMEKNELIEFLLALFLDMDFEGAKTLLGSIQANYPYGSDYFLHDKADTLLLNCRILVFENYCKIHQSVEVSTVAERMAMSVQEAEAWIVDKMRLGKLPFASIFFDEKDKAFVSFERKTSKDAAYKTIVDKTNTMAYRLYMLQVNSGTVVNKKDTLNLTDISPEINGYLVGAGVN